MAEGETFLVDLVDPNQQVPNFLSLTILSSYMMSGDCQVVPSARHVSNFGHFYGVKGHKILSLGISI